MCDDLPVLDEITKAERKDRERILNCVAISKGFTDWVDAYHSMHLAAQHPTPVASHETPHIERRWK